MSETSASSIVRQTRQDYEEMRRKLAETEQKLNRLARLEALNQASALQGPGRAGEPVPQNQSALSAGLLSQGDGPYTGFGAAASLDDVSSVRSELSTVPGSYTGFASRPLPASTPSKKRIPHGDGQPDDNNGDSDSSGSTHQGHSSSLKLLRQNQRLLSEVERLVCELQKARQREGELSVEMEAGNAQVTELQDKVDGLQAETEAQDKALRSAEQHLAESQRHVASLQEELSSCQRDLQDLRVELEDERRVRSSIETQRHELMRNFLEAQESLEVYQRRSQERIRKLEESEDHLRDSLAHTNAERDELLQQVEMLQSTVTQHETELERLKALSSVEHETKEDMEAQTLDLRKQLAKITTRLHKYEEEAMQLSVFRQENAELRSEVEESREVLSQLEEMTLQLRRRRGQVIQGICQRSNTANDSGNSSIHLGTSLQSASVSLKGHNSSKSQRERRAAGAADNSNNNGLTISNILSELRTMLFEMDEEIYRLRDRVASQQGEEYAVHELRLELSMLKEKAKNGEMQSQELERVVGRLEADKARLARKIKELAEQVDDKDGQVQTLDARIAQRNTQIIELQEDVSNRCTEIARLEKELWTKSAQVSQAEAILEEKRAEVEEHMAHLNQVERDHRVREEELASTRQLVKNLQMDLDRSRASEEHLKVTHTSHCRQYEAQIEKLQDVVSRKEARCSEIQHSADRALQECQEKDNLVHQLETTLLETKRELSQTTQRGKEVLKQLEDRLGQSTQQIQQLESALLLCRNEIREHIQTMERTRQRFDSELSDREHAITRLEARLKEVEVEVVRRTQDSAQLETELMEKQTEIEHQGSRITQLQHVQADLKDQARQLEQRLLREKAQWMTEADVLQRKMESQGADLDQALANISDLKQTIRELQEENRLVASERSVVERQLQEERSKGQSQATRMTHLEREMRDFRVELEQKIEMVGDLEDQLRNKDADLQQQQRLVEQLDIDKLHMQRQLKQLEERSNEVDDQVERLQFEVKAKDQILNDTRDVLRKTQAELSERSLEAGELKEALDERQHELNERVSMVTQLEKTIHDTHQEMTQRMTRVDSTLQKYEMEIKERTGQIADLDDKLQQTQKQLMETSLQLQQQQQLAQRQQMELQAASAKLEELDRTNVRQRQRLDDQKQENVEVTQELRLTREQLQTQHAEFLTARRELAAARREGERLARELEEVMTSQLSKDQDTARLSEELGASQARASQAEARLAAETRELQRTFVDSQARHREELELMRRSRDEAHEQLATVMEKLGAQAQQLTDNERTYRHRLDQARAELEALHNELSSRKELIRSANEAIFMKDSEIARMKAQVARYERKQVEHHVSVHREQQHHVATQPGHSSRHGGEQHITFSLSHDQQDDPSQQSAMSVQSYTNVRSQSPDGRHQHTAHHSITHRQVTNDGAGPSQHPTQQTARTSRKLDIRDLSTNAQLNMSQNAGELPMKDTWDDSDRDMNAHDYCVDQLVFSFEKLPQDLGRGGDDLGGGGNIGGREIEFLGGGGPSVQNSPPLPPLSEQSIRTLDDEIKGDRNNNAKVASDSGKSQQIATKFKQVDAKSQSKGSSKGQPHSQKGNGRRKGKQTSVGRSVGGGEAGGGGKSQGKKPSGRGEKGDYSHHHLDPETLVSTYQGDASVLEPQPEKEVQDLHQQLQANVLRQEEIERQLRSLDDDNAGDQHDLIDLSAD